MNSKCFIIIKYEIESNIYYSNMYLRWKIWKSSFFILKFTL